MFSKALGDGRPCGCVILGGPSTFALLVYDAAKRHLCRAELTAADFALAPQPNFYVSFAARDLLAGGLVGPDDRAAAGGAGGEGGAGQVATFSAFFGAPSPLRDFCMVRDFSARAHLKAFAHPLTIQGTINIQE